MASRRHRSGLWQRAWWRTRRAARHRALCLPGQAHPGPPGTTAPPLPTCPPSPPREPSSTSTCHQVGALTAPPSPLLLALSLTCASGDTSPLNHTLPVLSFMQKQNSTVRKASPEPPLLSSSAYHHVTPPPLPLRPSCDWWQPPLNTSSPSPGPPSCLPASSANSRHTTAWALLILLGCAQQGSGRPWPRL